MDIGNWTDALNIELGNSVSDADEQDETENLDDDGVEIAEFTALDGDEDEDSEEALDDASAEENKASETSQGKPVKPGATRFQIVSDQGGALDLPEELSKATLKFKANSREYAMTFDQLVATVQSTIPAQAKLSELTRETTKKDIALQQVFEENEKLMADLVDALFEQDEAKLEEIRSRYVSYTHDESRKDLQLARNVRIEKTAEERTQALELERQAEQDVELMDEFLTTAASVAIDSPELEYITEDNIRAVLDGYQNIALQATQQEVQKLKAQYGDRVSDKQLIARAWNTIRQDVFSPANIETFLNYANGQLRQSASLKPKSAPAPVAAPAPQRVAKVNQKAEQRLQRAQKPTQGAQEKQKEDLSQLSPQKRMDLMFDAAFSKIRKS